MYREYLTTDSAPDSRSSTLAPTARVPSRLWDLGAAAEGIDSANAALRQETQKGILHDDIMVTATVSSQSSPPHPSVDVPISGHLRSSLDAENTGELPHG